jgi:hypothetical protein
MGRSGASYDLTWTTTAVKTGTYTAAPWELVRCDASAGSFTVTLPAASVAGQQVAVKLLAVSGTFAVTVARAGSDTINAAGTTVTLTLADEALVLTSNGAGVWTIAQGRVTTASLDSRLAGRYIFTAPDHNLLAWTFDPNVANAVTVLTPAGTMNVARIKLPAAASITNIVMYTSNGTTLTTGQCFAALYSSAGTLIGQTADQAANWVSGSSIKTMALTGGPFVRTAGDLYVGFWYNGTTGPGVARAPGTGLSAAILNAGLAAPNLRYATADTSVTTTAPPSIGTQTAAANSWWIALS